MDANILNIKSATEWWFLYVLGNTLAIVEAQFMKKLSNSEAELKKKVIKKICISWE